MKQKLKRIKSKIDNFDDSLLSIFVKNRMFSNLYYFLKPSFRREERAVLYGRYQYNKNSNKKTGNTFFLRRSIHRLEKGILMRPRRDVFAESYIVETVENYKKLLENNEKSGTLDWAHDVLQNYFDIVDSKKSKKIRDAKYVFSTAKDNVTAQKKKLIPYFRNENDRPNIEIDEFEKLAVFRRSVRWFKDKSVDRRIIDKSVDIAGYSPSACNRIPYSFKIFDDKELVKNIASSAMGTSGYEDNIPSLVAVVGDLSAYPNERDRHLIYIDSSLAAMGFVYALELQGVGSCIINWPDIEKREKKINKFLDLEPYERVVMLIALGYEDNDGMVAFSQKKDIDEIRTYN